LARSCYLLCFSRGGGAEKLKIIEKFCFRDAEKFEENGNAKSQNYNIIWGDMIEKGGVYQATELSDVSMTELENGL